MAHPVIDIVEVTKSYGRTRALAGLSLSVEQGSIYGFLGRNGAGKTTTIKILLGLAHRGSGSVRVFGRDPAGRKDGVEVRLRTAFVSEEKDLHPAMTFGQMLRVTRPLYPSWNHGLEKRLLDTFGLAPTGHPRRVSKGTRTKMALVLALSRGTELLVLDEPTDGLDPAMQEEVLQVLVGLAASEGKTIFFSTHHLAEIEQIADSVCFIDGGRAVVSGSLDDLREGYRRVDLAFDREVAPEEIAPSAAARARARGRFVSLIARDDVNDIVLRARQLGATMVEVAPVSLKEMFLDAVHPPAPPSK
jgi:ABC-2 type transport system ATP-binding protein